MLNSLKLPSHLEIVIHLRGRLPRIQRPIVGLNNRADRLLKVRSPFSIDNKVSSWPTRQEIIIGLISEEIRVLK